MGRGPSSFKQSDVVRAAKALQASGLEILRTEIMPDGRLIFIHKAEADAPPVVDAYEVWKTSRAGNGDGRPA